MIKQKKIHYIYKTTCGITNRYYIGMHSTDDLNDGYMGSGKRLWFSINYHGKENHTKEILEYCDTREDLKKREEEIVNEQLLKEGLCMNLMIGGQGGFSSEDHMIKCAKAGGKASNYKRWVENREENLKIISEQSKKLWRNEDSRKKLLKSTRFTNKQHSEETKKKMSEANKGKGKGKNNSQFGTCWITRDGENKKIIKEDLKYYICNGWVKGRS